MDPEIGLILLNLGAAALPVSISSMTVRYPAQNSRGTFICTGKQAGPGWIIEGET